MKLRPPTDRPARPHHGFTLLELVIVMTLLLILVGITVPSLRGFMTGSLARDASTQIISLTDYARSKAASDSTIYRLNFDLSDNAYWLTAQENGTFSDLRTSFGARFNLPTGMRIELTPVTSSSSSEVLPLNNGSAVDFRPDGSSDSLIIRLIDADGHSQIIGAPSAGESYRLMTEAEVARL